MAAVLGGRPARIAMRRDRACQRQRGRGTHGNRLRVGSSPRSAGIPPHPLPPPSTIPRRRIVDRTVIPTFAACYSVRGLAAYYSKCALACPRACHRCAWSVCVHARLGASVRARARAHAQACTRARASMIACVRACEHSCAGSPARHARSHVRTPAGSESSESAVSGPARRMTRIRSVPPGRPRCLITSPAPVQLRPAHTRERMLARDAE